MQVLLSKVENLYLCDGSTDKCLSALDVAQLLIILYLHTQYLNLNIESISINFLSRYNYYTDILQNHLSHAAISM